ncbi:MAG: hypothetical protein IPI95_09555 [Flavobacteriales bacterium]|nr:hypothetical protein [Flavobacteriales bacterium]
MNGPHTKIWADSSLTALKNDKDRDPEAAIATTGQLISIYSASKDPCALAEVNGLRSTSFADIGKLDSAMACAHRALEGFRSGCDSLVLMRGLVALSYLNLKLDEYHRVDSICDIGLALWDPTWRPTVLRHAFLTNKAIAAARKGDLPVAETAFRTILQLATAEGEQQDMYDAIANFGAVKSLQGQIDSAEFYYRIGLSRALAHGQKGRIAQGYNNLAILSKRKKDHRRAIMLLDSALIYADAAKDLSSRSMIHYQLAENYEALGNYRNAYEQANLRYDLNDSLLSEEKVKTLAEMQAKYQNAKQDKEISSLRAEALQAELDKGKVKRTRNIFLFIGLGVLGLVVALLSRLRYINRTSKAMQKEKVISESLLHNILPEEVADEIKAKGYADVHEFEKATILFTDFKGFTEMTERMRAPELVAEIDHCFKGFDAIMEAHNIEKIKTIGDAYMAAGGLPDAQKGGPVQAVYAALEMTEFMRAYQAQRIAEGRLYFVMRTGLHTGPVIAGIVGVKKYAYDIWGDTVNVANRMETTGEIGKVNISQTTYDMIKDEQGLRFTPRGALDAKGKGKLNMYFVERA